MSQDEGDGDQFLHFLAAALNHFQVWKETGSRCHKLGSTVANLINILRS